jgi:PAS domain S-box-containing protein
VYDDQITERRQVEETLRIRNDLYAMLSRTDRAVRHCRSRDRLFQEVCTIAVETGHFRFAWIGAPVDDRVQRLASAGVDSGYMDELVITMDPDDPYSQGPTGRSFLSDQITIVNDFASSAMTAPWHELARHVGFAASAAFPLEERGQVVAALSLYAGIRDFFTTDLVETLSEITPCISFALDSFLQAQAEEVRRATEARYRALFENAPDGILIADPENHYIDANASMCRMLGYSRDELIGLHASDIVAETDIPHIEQALSVIKATSHYQWEWELRRKNGSIFSAEVTVTVMPDGNLLAMVRDVTERKQAEVRIQRLNRVYAVLSDINQNILREKDPQTMLETACRIAVEKGRLLMAWIGMVDAVSGKLEITAHAGATPDTLQILNDLLGSEQRQCKCIFTFHALQTGRPGVCNDVAHDPQAESWREAGLKRGYRAMASLPLKMADKVIGTFNLYADKPGFFDADEMRLLDELAMDISFALEVRDREAELRRQERALLEERTRLAREIHDTLAQGLTGIVIQLQVADRSGNVDPTDPDSPIRLARRLAEECLVEARRSVKALRPGALENHGLTDALQRLQEQMTSRIPIKSEWEAHGDPYPLPLEVENHLLRIGQEAITNVLRHSQATKLTTTLTYNPGQVRLRVEDNGRGFAPALHDAAGFGLIGMRERAAQIAAVLTIDSRPGHGTRVEVVVPIAIPL